MVLAVAAALAWGGAGCALQSEVMEIQDQVGTIEALQKKLEQQLSDAGEAAETIRAIGFRMEAVEEKVGQRSDPQVESRITQGLRDLEDALGRMETQGRAIDARIAEAERFFVRRVEEVSSRERALSSRLASLEESGLPPELRAARGDALGDLEKVKREAAVSAEGLARMQDQFRLMTDRLAQVTAAQQAAARRSEADAQGRVAPAELERVDLRLANLEGGAARDAQGRQQLADQVAQLKDQVAGLTVGQQDRAALSQTQAAALGGRLDAAERKGALLAAAQADLGARIANLATGAQDKAALSQTQAADLGARVDAAERRSGEVTTAQAELTTQVAALVQRLDGFVTAQGAQADRAADTTRGVAARVDALEQGNAAARAAQERLVAQVQLLAERVGALVAAEAARAGTDPKEMEARLAQLEGGKGQVERLAQLTDQLAVLGTQVTERLDAQASDFARLAVRIDRIEQGVEGFQAAPPEWGEALDKKVSFLADELTPRVDTQSRELTALADTVANGQEAADLNVARLSDRINTLGTSLVQRLDGVEARLGDAEQRAAKAQAAVPPDLAAVNQRLDLIGQEMPGRVDELTKVVGALRGQLRQTGERIALLETIQKQEATDLRERFNALSSALAEIAGTRAP